MGDGGGELGGSRGGQEEPVDIGKSEEDQGQEEEGNGEQAIHVGSFREVAAILCRGQDSLNGVGRMATGTEALLFEWRLKEMRRR